jgi:2-dehydropantoate 2-reductase
MRVAIVGAGAMGSIFAAAFADAGREVVVIDADPELVERVRGSGLTITDSAGGARTVRVEITSGPEAGRPAGVAVFLVKGFQTAEAAKLAAPVVGPGTIVVTAQNGMGTERELREAFPGNPVVVGNCIHSATVTGLGVVSHTGVGATYLGPDDGTPVAAAETVAGALAGSGFEVHVLDRDEVVRQRWAKLVMNCATLPVGALSGLDTERLGRCEPLLPLMDDLVRESCAVARAEGVELDPEERIAFSRGLLRTAGGRGSMSQDLLRGRRTEIDTINGAVVAAARRHHIEAVLNQAMVSLVHGRETALLGRDAAD